MSNTDRFEEALDLIGDKNYNPAKRNKIRDGVAESMNISSLPDEEKTGLILDALKDWLLDRHVKGAVDNAHRSSVAATRANAKADFE